MRGDDRQQAGMWSYISPEQRVPQAHPLRPIRAMVDTILAENADPLKDTIANLKTFSDGLARNTGKLDGIVAGLEKLTGGGAAAPRRLLAPRHRRTRGGS